MDSNPHDTAGQIVQCLNSRAAPICLNIRRVSKVARMRMRGQPGAGAQNDVFLSPCLPITHALIRDIVPELLCASPSPSLEYPDRLPQAV